MRNRISIVGLMGALAVLMAIAAACSSAEEESPTVAPQPTQPAAAAQPTTPPAPAAATAPAPAAMTAVPTAAAPSPVSSEQVQMGGILKVAQPYDHEVHDPMAGSAATTLPILVSIYPGLIGLDQQNREEIVGELADTWEVTEGGKVYTFHLRPGVKWHDGQPFTVEDVVFSMNNYNSPHPERTTGRGICAKGVMESVTALDQENVEVVLNEPSVSFMTCAASGFLNIGAKHILEPYYTGEYADPPAGQIIGTGPFKAAAHDLDTQWVLVRNEDYYKKGMPYLEGVTHFIMPDEQARIGALRGGQIHRLPTFPSVAASTAKELGNSMGDKVRVESYLSPGVGTHYYNLSRPPFDDARIRQAAELALDRFEMLDLVGEGEGRVSHPYHYQNWIIPYDDWIQTPGYRKDKAEDLAEAKRLVEAAYGGSVRTELICRTVSDYCDRAQVMKAQLAQVGIDVEIKAMESRAGSTAIGTDGDFEMGILDSNVAFTDPTAFFDVYRGRATLGYGSIWDETEAFQRVEELFFLQDAELDQAKRGAFLREVVDILLRDKWLGWEFRTFSYLIWSSDVQNYTVLNNQNAYDTFEEVWLKR